MVSIWLKCNILYDPFYFSFSLWFAKSGGGVFFLVPDFHPAPNDFFLSFSKLPVSSQTPFFLQNPAAPFSPSLLHFPYM